ncbi:ATP-dependent helicase HrpB [Pirellula staleyi DSM 6068]|uniref:ATP-dependent helicase HrpB n=1 Tax=Pirellula staleyi (strain ATCC 27377 / DSM 6068 / ICPB 4128) TaxID=530564 RepID=D2QWI1_PIRSD|nr:ATP-dependent helicase HrpB [Pirellula staleyi]ADB17784.1 ATP-dependent helicase HrpB [Pirellula staleyi DSM 6068]
MTRDDSTPPPLAPLPIDAALPELLTHLKASRRVVLVAPPGAGKTTRVPPAILDSGICGDKQIVVLQPRRLAARATAERMSSERGSRLGEEIGYQVRFESRVSKQTRIEVLTEGILQRRLASDPFLERVGCIVFDEFHERSLASDLLLGMVEQVRASVRDDLMVVVMSATLDASGVSKYLADAPVVVSEGRKFPVEIRYDSDLNRQPLAEQVLSTVSRAIEQRDGDLLVFLPGVGEIRGAQRLLENASFSRDFAIQPLYGDLSLEEQQQALRKQSRRKIVLATNVAETSVTVDGVTIVIDSGLARVSRYHESTGLDRLDLEPISRASADQRAGRAGRTAPGICYRLWPEAMHRARAAFNTPEVQRVDLAPAVLEILAWIEPDLATFPWYEPPASGTLDRAVSLLEQIHAADERSITELGRQMLRLPIHPRLARMMLYAREHGDLLPVATAAALLSERSPWNHAPGGTRGNFAPRRAREHSESDVLDRVQAIAAFEARGETHFPFGELNPRSAKTLLRTRDQLLRLVDAPRNTSSMPEDELLQRAILAGFPDRVAKRRETKLAPEYARDDAVRGLMVGGRGVKLDRSSQVLSEELFVCVELDMGQGEAIVRQASGVKRAWLDPQLLETKRVAVFDDELLRVQGRKRTSWNGLLLDESQAALPEEDEVAEILAKEAIARWDRVFPPESEGVLDYVLRTRLLARLMPKLELPPMDVPYLQSILPAVARGCRSIDDLRRAPWLMVIKNGLSWDQQQAIEREAPERIKVPSGNAIRLEYQADGPPILAVRIQEIFGLLETPKIAGGRQPILLHLLAPNMRVAQVTDDLHSFWASSYALVRKDLRARYPKHSWPEDPYTAVAQSRPARKN